MPPTIILIRHAEGLHNVDIYTIPDPVLTDLGRQQCRDLKAHLQEHLPLVEEVELVVVSPMRRTLETASLALDWLLERGVRVLPDAGWQENSDQKCDTGSPISVIASEFPSIDFSPVDPFYPEKKNPASNRYAYTRKAVLERGQACLQALYDRPEKVIAVVSHSGFLRCGISRKRYANADYRVFDFVATPEDQGQGLDAAEGERGGEEWAKAGGEGEEERRIEIGQFRLEEWKATSDRGGGMGMSKKGKATVEARDFGEQVDEEAVEEVPSS